MSYHYSSFCKFHFSDFALHITCVWDWTPGETSGNALNVVGSAGAGDILVVKETGRVGDFCDDVATTVVVWGTGDEDDVCKLTAGLDGPRETGGCGYIHGINKNHQFYRFNFFSRFSKRMFKIVIKQK